MIKHNSDGFTMIELLLVIITVGIISVVALPKFLDFRTEAKVATAQNYINGIKSAVVAKKTQMMLYCNRSAEEWPRLQAIQMNDITEGGNEGAACTASQIRDPLARRFFDNGAIVPENPFNHLNDIAEATESDLCNLSINEHGYYYNSQTGNLGHPQLLNECVGRTLASTTTGGGGTTTGGGGTTGESTGDGGTTTGGTTTGDGGTTGSGGGGECTPNYQLNSDDLCEEVQCGGGLVDRSFCSGGGVVCGIFSDTSNYTWDGSTCYVQQQDDCGNAQNGAPESDSCTYCGQNCGSDGTLTATCSWNGSDYVVSGNCYPSEQGGGEVEVSSGSASATCVGGTYQMNVGLDTSGTNVRQYIGSVYHSANYSCSGGESGGGSGGSLSAGISINSVDCSSGCGSGYSCNLSFSDSCYIDGKPVYVCTHDSASGDALNCSAYTCSGGSYSGSQAGSQSNTIVEVWRDRGTSNETLINSTSFSPICTGGLQPDCNTGSSYVYDDASVTCTWSKDGHDAGGSCNPVSESVDLGLCIMNIPVGCGDTNGNNYDDCNGASMSGGGGACGSYSNTGSYTWDGSTCYEQQQDGCGNSQNGSSVDSCAYCGQNCGGNNPSCIATNGMYKYQDTCYSDANCTTGAMGEGQLLSTNGDCNGNCMGQHFSTGNCDMYNNGLDNQILDPSACGCN